MFLATLFFLGALDTTTERQVESALVIGDDQKAVHLAKSAVQSAPSEVACHRLLLSALARSGREDALLAAYTVFLDKFKEQASDELLEEICFCILKKGFNSSNLTIREISLLALAMTQDIEGTVAIKKGLQDANKFIRANAASLAGYFGDGILKEEIIRLIHHEKAVEVRCALYTSVARLKMREVLPLLLERAAQEIYSPLERQAIVEAIVELKDKGNREMLQRLAGSPSSLLRAAVAAAIAHHFEYEHMDLVEKLLEDYHPDVKKAALTTMGALASGPVERLIHYTRDNREEIASAAARALFIISEKEGREAFSRLLASPRVASRRLAAAAACSLGEPAVGLLQPLIVPEQDPYVLFYAAKASLEARHNVLQAGEMMLHFLDTTPEALMEGQTPFFSIAKSDLVTHPLIRNFRTVTDQALRFKLLNLLAIVEHPSAHGALVNFLKTRQWQVVGMAAEILLNEGDDNILAMLEGFLHDPDLQLRKEAALILAALDIESAIDPLKELYYRANLQEKLLLMEALAAIGSRKLLPFFIQELKNPSQTVRVAAAAMVVRSLRS